MFSLVAESRVIAAPRRRRSILGLDADKAATAGMVILIVYAAVRSVFYAMSRPFWYDEVCTWAMARLPNVSALWTALSQAADGNPPGFYWIEHQFARIVPMAEIALRIPSILGFCCTLWCVFLFIRKRSGAVCALVCSGALLTTLLFDYRGAPVDLALSPFAIEARPYSLVLACVSIALVCYQRANRPLWMLLMGVSLALAQTLHYYAIFALAPIALAEAARFLKTRQIRWSVWLALIAGLLPLGLFWPLLSHFRALMGAHFWVASSLLGAVKVYGRLLQLPVGLGVAVAGLIGIVLLKLSVTQLGEDPRSREGSDLSEGVPFHEYILVLAIFGLPFIAFVATRILHGGMTTRYVLSTLLAFPLAAGYILPRLNRNLLSSVAFLICFFVTYQEVTFWRNWAPARSNPGMLAEKLLNSVGYGDLPVIVVPPEAALAIAYYTPIDSKPRISVLLDRRTAIAYSGSDSGEAQLYPLHSYIPLRIREFSNLSSDQSTFLLYADPGSWFWLKELVNRGYSLRCLTTAAGPRAIYLVESPAESR